MEIVLATRNKKKAEEMSRLLNGLDITILTLNDFPYCPEVEEDEDTFEGNAVKKAMAVARCTNKIAVADDSGLEVYALNGAPGVMSARYAGENANDIVNMEKLLVEMKDMPDEKRGARFVCCIAVVSSATESSDETTEIFFGYVEGRIGREPCGITGFGYDPVFYPAGYDRTFAEMSPEQKDALSHRGDALRKFKDYIKKTR
ncbi:MAG: XTP/dITP diphosphatase [Thermodesulfovibrionales bacterium]|nr:XTP/dITP diphosphatase [Thermodesulfovibrionales bacterium]